MAALPRLDPRSDEEILGYDGGTVVPVGPRLAAIPLSCLWGGAGPYPFTIHCAPPGRRAAALASGRFAVAFLASTTIRPSRSTRA